MGQWAEEMDELKSKRSRHEHEISTEKSMNDEHSTFNIAHEEEFSVASVGSKFNRVSQSRFQKFQEWIHVDVYLLLFFTADLVLIEVEKLVWTDIDL